MNKYVPKKVNNFLPDIPINVDSKDKLFSLASSHNLSELEEFITTDSISLNVKNEKNQSIMHVLLEGESTTDEEELLRCIKFLVERGAPISSIDNNNLTPLFICIKKKYPNIFKFLLDRGASLDINTHDDLTVLHEIAKPEHTTYDAKGIQDLIPEKVQKMTMEGYEKVYKVIVDAIEDEIENDTNSLDLKNKLEKFKTIAKQFYYHDEREDFNNVLLLEEANSNPNIKNELFKKLKNQLKEFYTSDKIDDINNQEIIDNFLELRDKLNKEFAQNNMHKYNDNILNAIKSIAYSLELSSHFFFNYRIQTIEELNKLFVPQVLQVGAAGVILTPINNIITEFNNTLAQGGAVNREAVNLVAALNAAGNYQLGVQIPQYIINFRTNLNNVATQAPGAVGAVLTPQDFFTLYTLFKLIKTIQLRSILSPEIETIKELFIDTALQVGAAGVILTPINNIITEFNNTLAQGGAVNREAVNLVAALNAAGNYQLGVQIPQYIINFRTNLNNVATQAPGAVGAVLTPQDFFTLYTLFELIKTKDNGGLLTPGSQSPLPGPPLKLRDQFMNIDLINLGNSYKLQQVLPQNISFNNNYKFNHNNEKKNLTKEIIKYIESNTIYPAVPRARGPQPPPPPQPSLALYRLELDDQNYTIDYFNLLHSFNEYAKNNYNNIVNNIRNIFDLYKNIQNIYKYNYIIYIFEKEREKILNLKNYKHDNIELKGHLDNLFDKTFKNLENSVNLIKQQLKKIEKLSNDYIDIYNKKNIYNIYNNTYPIYIGIYPKIQFPTEIKYTKTEEDTEIRNIRGNYKLYNKYKNNFFHKFILYFQDIGNYNQPGIANNFLNDIPPYPIDYNITINPFNTIINDKAYKLYYYDPTYLKLEKQKLVEDISNNVINNIPIPKFDNYNTTIADKLKNEIKNKILNEILEEQFNNYLVLEINNLLKKTDKLEYKIRIKEPNFNEILLKSAGFSSILIPNYEFKNNKFLSISKNKFLDFRLYFDTNYFKDTSLNTLKYYKTNEFIIYILKKQKSLLLKTDIKGWTPIYYAIDGNNYEVIDYILNNDENKKIDTLIHYDHKKISPLKLCINKQLNHLNYLLTDDNKEIHYLNNYIKMLRNELKSNNVFIPLNIDSVFIIALFIQNHIWSNKVINIDLDPSLPNNTRKTQIIDEYYKINTKKYDVDTDVFNHKDSVKNDMDKPKRNYDPKTNDNYNDDFYNGIDTRDPNTILKKYYNKSRELEKQDFGFYGSYWKNYDKNIKILEHINISIKFKDILKQYLAETDIEIYNDNFNLPSYNKKELNKKLKTKLNKLDKDSNITFNTSLKSCLERYLKFINIRFNSNKDNAYAVFLNKIYVHALANIIGVDFYLKMEELIVKHYMNLNIEIDQQIPATAPATKPIYPVYNQLKNLNKLLINNKLDDSNINYKYISATKNPELALKKDIIDILNNEFIPNNEELINIFETKVYPNYRDLYKITFKYLKMFISNYHKFIYNQYHGLEILLLLVDKISS